MMKKAARLNRIFLALAVGATALSADEFVAGKNWAFFADAHAVRGRPATPLSYAGVARRTTRRAYAAGVASGPRCVRVADAYGRMVTRCY
jgi:hypothetical protein